MSIGIVLLEPEMPGNAGAIGRTCLCAGATLHLIEPLGFYTDDKSLRRAGLDYWPRLGAVKYTDLQDFEDQNPNARVWYVTTKAHQTISQAAFQDGDFLMLGKESAGLPEELLAKHPDRCIRIPMAPSERSLNLASAAAIVLYEALRQLDYPGLEKRGELHRLTYE